MGVTTLQMLRLLLDPRVTGPPLRAARTLRQRGIRRLPDDVFAMESGRLRPAGVRRTVAAWLDGERLTRHGGRWVLNSFLPPFPGTAYARMFANITSGRRLSPVSAFLAVTARCTLRCPHCSAGDRRSGPEVSGDAWRQAIGELHGLGVSLIGLTGGEPCLRDDLPDLVRAAASGGAEAIVFTSGTGFTPELARSLARAGLWSVCVSLDSDAAAEHDAWRGSGAWDRAVEAIRAARSAGFYTMVGAVATPDAVESRRLERVWALAGTLGVHEVRLVEPMPCGRLTGCAATELLTPDQIAAVRRFHVETNRRGRGPVVCAFNQIESPEVFGCGAGTQHLYIDATGCVCPCDFTPMSFGRIGEAPLAEVWARMNRAMGGAPRERCFIQRHHARLLRMAGDGLPLPPEASEALCAETEREPMPAFFRQMAGGGTSAEDAR